MPVPGWVEQAGAQAAGQAASGILGLVFGGINDRRQLKQQKKLNMLQRAETDYNMSKQLEMWKETGPVGQKEQLKAAGLNPGLIYGMGGVGGATANVNASSPSQAPSGGGELMGAMGMGMQLQLLKAQKELLQSQTEKNKVEAAKTAGVDTELAKAEVENKILQQVVTDYTGREAKDVYEQIKAPNRSVEAKTYQDELEARQGVAGTIYEMWKEGKLKDKSMAEVEQLLLQNAKTREETRNIYKTGQLLEENLKGAKLDNVIKDLETRLQTETGIDRNSPTWLKILGRLFVELTK